MAHITASHDSRTPFGEGDDRPDHCAPPCPTHLRFIFIAECSIVDPALAAQIVAAAERAEPFVRAEIIALLRALFGGAVQVRTSEIMPL